jgi:hypothetical protein
MSRRIAVLTVLALAGATLIVPEPSVAAGFRGGVARGAPFRAPMFHRAGRAGVHFRQPAAPKLFRLPATRALPPAFAHTNRAGFGGLERRAHHRHVHRYGYGYGYPFTTYDEGAYFGIPYDPAVVIPVYAPPSVTELGDMPFPPPPRLSGTIVGPRDENGETCRAERVVVPAAEGERTITVVRC